MTTIRYQGPSLVSVPLRITRAEQIEAAKRRKSKFFRAAKTLAPCRAQGRPPRLKSTEHGTGPTPGYDGGCETEWDIPQAGMALMPSPHTAHIETFRSHLKITCKKASVADIVQFVAAKYGVTPEEIYADLRKKYVVHARHEAFYLAAKLTSFSMPSIGKFIGKRDHSSVLHGIAQHCLRHDLPHPRNGVISNRNARRRIAR